METKIIKEKFKRIFSAIGPVVILIIMIGIYNEVFVKSPERNLEIAKEVAAKENLNVIRNAILIYYSDKGAWPENLTKTFNNYLYALPTTVTMKLGNTNKVLCVKSVPVEAGAGWAYNSATGEIWCNSIEEDCRGTPFTNY